MNVGCLASCVMSVLQIFVDYCTARIFCVIRDYSLVHSAVSRIQEVDAPNEGPQDIAARSLLLSQPVASGLEPNADFTVQPYSEIQTEEGRGRQSAYQLAIYLANVSFGSPSKSWPEFDVWYSAWGSPL
jgi:hypothetical protein